MIVNSQETRNTLKPHIFERDKYQCVLCGSKCSLEIHEVIPRSRFGKLTMHLCFVSKNMCTLCHSCHEKAHNVRIRVQLLQLMQQKFKYQYDESHYKQYLG